MSVDLDTFTNYLSAICSPFFAIANNEIKSLLLTDENKSILNEFIQNISKIFVIPLKTDEKITSIQITKDFAAIGIVILKDSGLLTRIDMLQVAFLGLSDDSTLLDKFRANLQDLSESNEQQEYRVSVPNFDLDPDIKKKFNECRTGKPDISTVNEVANTLNSEVTKWALKFLNIADHVKQELSDKSVAYCLAHWQSYLQVINSIDEQLTATEGMKDVITFLLNHERKVQAKHFQEAVNIIRKAVPEAQKKVTNFKAIDLHVLDECDSIVTLHQKVDSCTVIRDKTVGYHLGYDIVRIVNKIYNASHKIEKLTAQECASEQKAFSSFVEIGGIAIQKKPVGNLLSKLNERLIRISTYKKNYTQLMTISEHGIDLTKIEKKYKELYDIPHLLDVSSSDTDVAFNKFASEYQNELANIGEFVNEQIKKIVEQKNRSIDSFLNIISQYSSLDFLSISTLDRLKLEVLSRMKEDVQEFSVYLNSQQKNVDRLYHLRCFNRNHTQFAQNVFYRKRIESYRATLMQLSSISDRKEYKEIEQQLAKLVTTIPNIDPLLESYRKITPASATITLNVVRYNTVKTIIAETSLDGGMFQNLLYTERTNLIKPNSMVFSPDSIKSNEALKEYLEIYQQIIHHFPPSLLSLTAESINDIQVTIKKLFDPKIKQSKEIPNFVQKVEILIDRLKTVPNISEQIQIKLNELDYCFYDNKTFDTILNSIEDLIRQFVVLGLTVEKYVRDLNEKIADKLSVRLNTALELWIEQFRYLCENNSLPPIESDGEKKAISPELTAIRALLSQTYTYSIVRNKNQFVLEPSLYDIRDQWNQYFNDFIQIIQDLKTKFFLGPPRREKDKSIILRISGDNIETAMSLINKHLIEIHLYVKEWLQFHVIWDVNIASIKSMIGSDILKWEDIINSIIQVKKELTSKSDTVNRVGPSILQLQSAIDSVSRKYDSLLEGIHDEYSTIIGEEIDSLHTVLTTSKEFLERTQFKQTSEDIPLVLEINSIKKNSAIWEAKISTINKTDNEVKKKLHNKIQLTQLNGTYSGIMQLYDKRLQVYTQILSKIKQKVKDEEGELQTDIRATIEDWKKENPKPTMLPGQAVEVLDQAKIKFTKLNERFLRMVDAKIALDLPVSEDNSLSSYLESIDILQETWKQIRSVWDKMNNFGNEMWSKLNANEMKIGLDQITDELTTFSTNAQCHPSFVNLQKIVESHVLLLPLLRDIKNAQLKERHWTRIFDILHIQIVYENMTLSDLWNSSISKSVGPIREVLEIAQGERALEETLLNITEIWRKYELDITIFQQKYKLIRGWEDMFLILDDHLGSFLAMKQSPYFDVVKQQAEEIEKKLIDARVLFEMWMEVQRKYMYFYGVFSPGSGIQNQLAKGSATFASIDNDFISLTKNANKNLKMLNIQNSQEIKDKLELLGNKLSALQRSLSDYLEGQRTAFSRFYFIGDDDLLEIIGHSTDPIKLQRHLGKLFAGISSLELSENDTITALHSREGEDIDLKEVIKISDFQSVNGWLAQVEKNMQKSLAALLDTAFSEITKLDDPQQFIHFIQKYPSQILLLSTQVHWCHSMESGFSTKKITSLDIPLKHSLKLLTILVDGVLSDLSYKDRKKYEQLITEYVYERDVTQNCVDNNIINADNVEWEDKLKYYYNPKETELLQKLNIRIANASFYYGFEYLGVAERLVQTPLTDRCYLTLTQALHLKLGGNPFGPAGTGKTETVKALGSQLGRFVLVFNCGENFDFLAMGRIFRGLCQVGAWGCFDEFNRLEERILSAVSQQIQTIQIGLLENQRQIQLLDHNVVLHQNVGIFVTMNPGYAGRSNLPDNLKQLFRSFAMIQPDWDLISQVMLFSQGFQTSNQLARRIVLLFSLCGDQLSSQPHYDFGLRALKSVLVSAGSVKRSKLQNIDNIPIDKFEQNVLLESITQTVVPKLVAEDVPLLDSLISSVFPGESLFEIEDAQLSSTIVKYAQKYHLTLEQSWLKKILQLHQVLLLRHGVMLVGPSGTGKSYSWKVLLEALSEIQETKGEYYIIDPKGMGKDELYGKLDNTTMEWSDGIFTHILRQIVESRRGEDKKRHWIIFDGDVDPEWAENLNSVLDDNKVLTLPNGERLPLNDNVRIIFEVENLRYATLATVSRCGMIWYSSTILNTQAYLKNFIQRLENEELTGVRVSQDMQRSVKTNCVNSIRDHFSDNGLIEKALKWCLSRQHIMEVTELRLLNSCLSLLKRGMIILLEYNEEHPMSLLSPDAIASYYPKWLLFSLIWSFSGSASMNDRVLFCEYLKEICRIEIPQNGNLIDYEVKVTDCQWHLWKDSVPRIDIEPDDVIHTDVVIPTVDTLRHKEIIKAWLASHEPVILCGPPGSGKSMTITSCLSNVTNLELASLNFSSATTPELILKTFNQYCNYIKTPTGAILRPKQDNKWLGVFCDEINLPEQDQYGTQRVISFIRQLVEQNGFWKPKESVWVTLERIQFIGACNPPTDPGRVPLSTRFLTHTPLILVDFPDQDSLLQIYSTFNRALLSLQLPLKALADNVTQAMVTFYQDNQHHFTTDARPHYIYSPRELSRWTRALYEVLSIRDNMTIEDLVRLWVHEGLRLFSDRLVTSEEKTWCNERVDEVAIQYFPKTIDTSCLKRPIYYTNWLSKVYESVTKDALKSYVETKLKTFYEEVLDVQLVVFDDMLDHILRIDRVLRQPLGHLLLVGESGVGKTVLSRLVAWVNGLSVFQLKISHKYTIDSFDEDLRELLKRAGLEDEKICFIFDESNVLSSAFLERMNALLASGDVPGLFDEDQTRSIIRTIKDSTSFTMDSNNTLTPYQFFLSRIQHNLHIVFTMNPSNGDYNNRTTTSPALFNRCVIDWFGTWPREALAQVGSQLLHLDFSEDSYHADPSVEAILPLQHGVFTKHDAIVCSMVMIHDNVKQLCSILAQKHLNHNFICPRDYLDFIHHYLVIWNEKREFLEEQQKHLNTGLTKLKETEVQVKNMQINLKKKETELKDKEKLAEEKLGNMLEKQKVAETSKAKAEKMGADLREKEARIHDAKVVIEKELAEVEPKIQAAKDNVQNIDKRALNEIKSLAKPPRNVELTIAMVSTMFGYDFKEWKDLKKMMVGGDFITSILNFDSTNLSASIIKTINNQYISQDGFNYEAVLHSSKACAPLYQWVVSQIEYGSILEKVEPKQKQVADFTKDLNVLGVQFKAVQDELNALTKEIDRYKHEYNQLIVETTQIQESIKTVSQNVNRSISLVASLQSERDRWDVSTKTFTVQLNTLDGDCLLGSGFLAYIGFFNHKNRKQLLVEWNNILDTYGLQTKDNLSIIEYLSTPTQRLNWTTNYSLLNDDLYMENGILLNRCIRYPLVIDPSGQSLVYLTKLYEKAKISKSSFLNNSFMKDLESSVRFGYPLLVQDVENIDPILNPLLNKELHKTGGRTLVRIGDRDIDFSPTFRLFLTTRDFSFQFGPDISSRVTFVNFTVTPSSLESQTLNKLLKAERPEVEEERNKLLLLQGQYQIKLRELEEKLLDELNGLEGNILENTSMINTLELLKKESKEIANEMDVTLNSMTELNNVSGLYLPLASLVSRIYFAMEQLGEINFLYHFSLPSYLHLIEQLLTPVYSPELKNLTEPSQRIQYLNTQLFDVIYHHFSRSLMIKDSIVLALRLAQIKLMGERDEPTTLEYDLLFTDKHTTSSLASSTTKVIEKMNLELDDTQKQLLNNLLTISQFDYVKSSLESHFDFWKKFLTHETPEDLMPTDWDKFTSDDQHRYFKWLLLLKAFRPDRLLFGYDRYIKLVFGETFLQPSVDIFSQLSKETFSEEPILFCSQRGYDPSQKVELYAKENGKKLLSIALGSSEGFTLASKAIPQAAKEGSCVLLRNVHLCPSWLTDLIKLLYSLSFHPDFRLFLTAEIHPNLPTSLIQLSYVVIFEPPDGVHSSLTRSLSTIPDIQMNKVPTVRAKLYFLISWIHAIIVERLRYSPIGWTKQYEFNDADFNCAIKTIDEYIDNACKGSTDIKPESIKWDALRSLLCTSVYGGKIDNQCDEKLLHSIMYSYFIVENCKTNIPLVKDGDNVIVKTPVSVTKSDYLGWTATLPQKNSPIWLGLPVTAEIRLLQQYGFDVLHNITLIQDTSMENEVVTIHDDLAKPQWMKVIAESVASFIQTLVPTVNIPERNDTNLSHPLFRFLEREVTIASKLLNAVHADLLTLQRTINGEIKSTNNLRSLINDFRKDLVPKEWKQIYRSTNTTISMWIHDFNKRVIQLNQLAVLPIDRLLKTPIWLGGLFYPEAYITATRQSISQDQKLSLEDLVLIVSNNDKELLPNEFLLSNLSVEGGEYTNHELLPTQSIKFIIDTVRLSWSIRDQIQLTKFVEIPLYLNSERTSLLLLLHIPSQLSQISWNERGCGIIAHH